MKGGHLSEQMRRAQPLSVKAVGFVCDQGVAAFANWDRVEVRTDRDEVLLRHESDGRLLHPDMEFVHNRYVVLPFGTGVMMGGFKVYDFQDGRWAPDVATRPVEIGFCGAHPSAPMIAIEEGDGLRLWDLAKSHQSGKVPIQSGINVAALGGPEDWIAVGGFESVTFFDRGREMSSLHAAGGDVTAMAWNRSSGILVCGNAAGEVFEVDGRSSAFIRSMGSIRGEVRRIRISIDGKAAAAVGFEGEAIFMRFDDLRVAKQSDVYDVAFSPTAEGGILVARTEGMERLEVGAPIHRP